MDSSRADVNSPVPRSDLGWRNRSRTGRLLRQMAHRSTTLVRMKPDEIRVGKRHRTDVGDVRTLARSIATLGLLHPIVVNSDKRLIAGARRLAAIKSLGWKDCPVRIIQNLSDAADALRAERDENVERKPFLPSELVSIARQLEPLERAEAKKRQGTRTDKHPARLTGGPRGDSRDRLARVVGVSHLTLSKARAVVEAAERDPKRCRGLVAEMDRTGNVSAAFNALQRIQWQQKAEKTRIIAFPKAVDIRHCSMETLLSSLRGVDCILTDPLYDRGSLPLYGELARLAQDSLRPGGTLAVLCGQSYLPEVFALMTPHLTYRWTLAFMTPSKHCRIHARKVYSRWKPLLVFEKARTSEIRRGWIPDVLESQDSGRQRHPFEQSEEGFRQLVEMLTVPGELVIDPFLGSGTTGVACVRSGRRFIGADIDHAAIRSSRARLNLLLHESNQTLRRRA